MVLVSNASGTRRCMSTGSHQNIHLDGCPLFLLFSSLSMYVTAEYLQYIHTDYDESNQFASTHSSSLAPKYSTQSSVGPI